ncbi:MAG: DMT family transporter [Betaproteobacteria bacterium]|nr:MAG: DMT family transporter [Betaproteobacteria bacterium]
MRSHEHHLKADLLLVLTTLIAAAGWIFSKEALGGLPPLLFVGTRFLIAGLVLAAFSVPQLCALERRGYGSGVLVGALFAAAMALWILGLQHTRHIGESSFIASLGVVLVPVFARLFFGERPPATTWAALPLALAGFACLSLAHGFRVEPGQWFFLGAAVVFALLFNVNSHVVRNVPVLALSTLQMLVVGLLVLPFALWFERWPDQVSLPVLGWLAASALIATTLRFLLQLYGQSLTTPSHAAIILMLEPVWTAVLAAWWFSETMTALQLAGCTLIFAALLISRWNWIRGLFRGLFGARARG